MTPQQSSVQANSEPTQRTELAAAGPPAKTSREGVLSREQELELTLAWRKDRSVEAADRIVRSHLRFVVGVANRYRRYGYPLDELVAEGNFGLVHALSKFDPDRGFRFVTYAAHWVRAYILNYILCNWSMVGAGSGALRSKNFFRLRRERAKLGNLIEDPAERTRILAERMQVSQEQVQSMLRQLEVRDASLDTKVFSDSETTLVETLVSPEEDDESKLGRSQILENLRAAVQRALKQLDPRENFIVERRLMADKADRLTLAAIGRTLGVSRERARQLETRAKSKLRSELVALPEEAKPDWLMLNGFSPEGA